MVRMIPISSIVTRITLEKKTNKNGQPYAGDLAPEKAMSARKFRKHFSKMMKSSDAQSA